MSGQGWAVARLDDVETHVLPGGARRSGIREHLDIRSFGITPPEDWITVDEALAAELRDRLDKLGYEGELDKTFNDWAGTENLEERVDGLERIDPVVLGALRKQSG